MLTSTRRNALKYSELARTATDPGERREFRRLDGSLNALADNEQWLKDNRQKIVVPGSLRPVPVSE